MPVARRSRSSRQDARPGHCWRVLSGNTAYRDHPGTEPPGWLACTTARPGRSPRAGLGKPVEFGHKEKIVDTDDGIIVDHQVHAGIPAEHHNWARRSNGSKPGPVVHHGQ